MRIMKNSGIEWIGEIPKDWIIKRNKQLFYEVNERCENGNEHTLLSVSEYYGIAPKAEKISDNEFETRAESLDGYKLCQIGDIVMNIMLAWKHSTGRSAYNGIVSPAYCVYRPIGNIDTKYYHYLFRTDIVSNLFKQYSTGIIDSRLRLYPDKFLALKMIVPPLPEQKAISAYLDKKCILIDSVIEKTKITIEEYKKLRQAVITQAVTKGIRGNRPMKDSGIAWIGEIPEEWKKTKLGHISSLRSGITLGRKILNNAKIIKRPYLRVANVQNGYVDISNVTVLEVTEEEDAKYRLHRDDVLMTEGGDRDKLGRGCVWNGAIEPCLHQNHIFALRTNIKHLNQYYFAYITASQIGRVYFDITAIKTTNLACTSSSKVMAFIIPLPSIEEQQEIASYLDKKCAEIDTLITKKEQFLKELESYKKSLIYEYVTGKKEVQP